MNQSLGQITILVDEYDKAIEFFVKALQFELVEDTIMSDVKRWVIVRPQGSQGCSLLLAKAANQEQASRIGNQTGGRVFLFLYTDSFDEYYDHLQKHNVKIIRQPSHETYGKVAVFQDIYGNLWDLIEPSKM